MAPTKDAITEPGPRPEPLRLKISAPQFESIIQSDHDGSSPEENDPPRGIAEEEVQSVVGPSISRAQTRMMSPQTPAAEKAAAMGGLDGGGLFDGPVEDKEPEESYTKQQGICYAPADYQQSSGDSPGRQTNRVQKISSTSSPESTSAGPTSVFPDLNVRKYVTSFSLPKISLLNRFSVPSLGSVLGSSRSQSPIRKSTRNKRASTIGGNDTSLVRWGDGGTPKNNVESGDQKPQSSEQSSDNRRVHSQVLGFDSKDLAKEAISKSPTLSRPPYLRRATSDQSLFLRRAASTVPSLGDDSRWENVQEQVNSRMKAIKDSFQDSSIKLPSLPNMPSFNLNPFRPDINTRERAQSYGNAPAQSRNNDSRSNIESKHKGSMPNFQASSFNGQLNIRKDSSTIFSHFDHALEQLTGDLVILGGYRGSILRSAKPPHRQLWVPVKVGLNIRKVNLEVGLEPEDEENMERTIFPSGMLSHIGPVDMGRRLLKRLHGCKNVENGKLRIHDYGYDWRLSPALSSRKLIEFLQKLPSNQENISPVERGALVIAHSMGGLITRHAVNQRPDLFAGVVYAGVPQHCVNILGPFRNGDDVLLSSKVLTAQVNFTMRSSFVLLPDDGVCFVDKETKEEYPVDFFDVETWKEHALSPCISSTEPPFQPEKKSLLGSISDSLPSLPAIPLPTRKSSASTSTVSEARSSATGTENVNSSMHKHANLTDANSATTRAVGATIPTSQISTNSFTSTTTTIPYSTALSYLRRTLAETLEFRRALSHNPSHQSSNLYPPHSTIYATNTPTVSRARVACRAAIQCADAYDDLQFGSGDGVVLARAAMLPTGYKCARGGRIKTERGHVGLLGDLEAVGRCLNAVVAERRKGVGLGLEGRTGRESGQ